MILRGYFPYNKFERKGKGHLTVTKQAIFRTMTRKYTRSTSYADILYFHHGQYLEIN